MPAVPISVSGTAQNPWVLFTHHRFWAAFLQQPLTPTISNSCNRYLHSFLLSLGMHWACASCTVPIPPSTIPQYSTVLHSTHWCSHNTQSFHQQFFPLLEYPPPVPGPSHYSQMYRATNKSPIHCNGIISPLQTSLHGATQVQNAIPTRR